MTTGSARYEQLIQDLKADFRPQREWVERQGYFSSSVIFFPAWLPAPGFSRWF